MQTTMTLLTSLRRIFAVLAVLTGLSLAAATNFNLSLTKTTDLTSVAAGGSLNFTITVKNAGPYAATNVVIQDALPKGFKFVSATPAPSATDSTSDPKVVKYTFNLGTINSGATTSITVKATGVASANLSGSTIGSGYDYINVAQVYSVDNASYDSSGSRPNNCTYSTIQAGSSMEDDCAKVTVNVTGTVTPPSNPPVSGTCTATSPYIQSFNTNAALAEVASPYVYKTDPNVVTSTDGTYTLWNSIDHTGNNGYALFMNIANYAGNNGARLSSPALLYQSTINVPAGSTINYQDYIRSHSTVYTQLRYVFTDTASGTVLKQYDGNVATTNYTLDTVPSFTASGSQVTLRIYSIFDGTSADANVLKLDDLKLSCTPPTPTTTDFSVSKSADLTTANPGDTVTYTVLVKNVGANSLLKADVNGKVSITDTLPAGVTLASSPVPGSTYDDWACTTSGSTINCTNSKMGDWPVNYVSGIKFSVTVGGSASGTLTNTASISSTLDTNSSNNTATASVTVQSAPVGNCSTMYALVSGQSDVNGRSIYPLTESNALGTKVTNLPSMTSATLGVSPDGLKFYTVADSSNVLWTYDSGTAKWTSGGTFSGVSGRMIRMAVTPSGTGYAMDSTGHLWSFTLSGSTSYIGTLTSTTSAAPSFYENGDFISTADGKLYLLSAQASGAVSMWFVDPVAKTAEYLGDLSNSTSTSQYGGLAVTANGLYASNHTGILAKVDLQALKLTQVGSTNSASGSTDLTSCSYPNYTPSITAVKSVKKVAGSSGSDVQPGDTLEYSITVRNSGTLAAGGTTFQDALPAGTTYVADSAKVNGFTSTAKVGGGTLSLSGSSYPFSNAVGICSTSSSACTTQVLYPDTTATTIDNEAVITFRVTVNSGVTNVSNKGIITYNDGKTPPTPIPTNQVDTPVVPIVYPQLSLTKANNGPWTVGQTDATYTLSIRNTSTVASSGTVTITDQLPAGIGMAPASGSSLNGWTCKYSGEAEQGGATNMNPITGQLVTCTSSASIAAGGSSTLSLPVTVAPNATSSVTNTATVAGGGDPDAAPTTCTTTAGQCAVSTTSVTQLPSTPAPVCSTGTPVNLLSSALSGYQNNDSTTLDIPASLISNASTYSPASSNGFIIDGSYYFNNGYGPASNAATLKLMVNGTVYATFVSNGGYSGEATVTASNGATISGSLSSLKLNRLSRTPFWIQLPASVTSISSAKLTYQTSASSGEVSDDYGYTIPSIYGCAAPVYPQLTITKTGNGPWTVGQSGASYSITVTNTSATATSGMITVKDLLPTGMTPTSSSFTVNGWTCSTSAQTLTCTTSNVIAANTGSTFSFGVNVDSSAVGSSTNKASVAGGGDPDPQPDPASCTTTGGQCATYTTTITSVPATCTGIYALTLASGGNNTDGVAIRKLDETNNTLGNVIASLPYIGYYQGASATLAVSPDGKKFFTALDSDRLRVYDSATGTWAQGSTFANASNRLVRMAVTPNGTGYAMDSDGNFWSFQTVSPYGTSYLGKLNSASSGAPDFHVNGDFFATADGKLYMISAVTGSTNIDLWLINPSSMQAEYLGPISVSGATQDSQFNGIAASPNGVYARDNLGRLVKIDLVNLTYSPVGSNTLGSTDLASCYYPTYTPKLDVIKSVKKVAGTTGEKVQPGDTLEYSIVVRNTGTLPAGGVTFQDALPAGTTYVADSARVNGATTTVTGGNPTNLSGSNYPFSNAVGICSNVLAPCTTQVLKIDTTPSTTDNEAVITFRVTVNNPFTLDPSQVNNQANVNYTGGSTVPSNIVITPVYQPAKLTVVKTVRNVTMNGPVGTSASGNPGDVLEYCIATTNIGGLNATNIIFGDNVPTNTTFLVGAYAPGQDIKVTTSTGDVYYTAAADGDPGNVTLNNGVYRVSVNGGSFILGPTQAVTICFRTTIK